MISLQLVGTAVGHDQTVCSAMEVSVFVLRPSLEDTKLVGVVVGVFAVYADVVEGLTVTVTVVGAGGYRIEQ